MLLPRIQWYCQDVYDFCEKSSDLSEVLLVTDGGAAGDMGTFGWVIGTTSGTRLAAGSGPVFGFDPRSYSEYRAVHQSLTFCKAPSPVPY